MLDSGTGEDLAEKRVDSATKSTKTTSMVNAVAFTEDLETAPGSLRDAMASEAVKNVLSPMTSFQPDDDESFDSPTCVTLETVEALAMGWHPAIAEARALVEANCGQYQQAGLPFNPVLQYQSEEIGNEGGSGLHSIRLSQQIVTANKLSIGQQVQAREIQKQRARLRIAELTVLARVRALFAKSLVAQERSQIADSIVAVAEESVASVSALYDAEEVSKISVLQAVVELEQTRIAAENATTNYHASLKSLAAAVGGAELPNAPLVADLEATLVEQPWEPLLAELAQMSSEMSLAGSELERAKWSLRLACAQVVPNVTLQAGAGYDGSSDDTFGVFGVSVPLPLRNRNR
ncbi:MAG: TolC family protein, partial [Planctomycetota bacterium]